MKHHAPMPSAESLGRKQNHTDSLQEAIFVEVVSAGSKRSQTVSAEAKYDGQYLQEGKISGLVYTKNLFRPGSLLT